MELDFDNIFQSNGTDGTWDEKELRAVMVEYHTLKWGATLTLFMYTVAFLMVVF